MRIGSRESGVPDILPVGFRGDAIVGGDCGGEAIGDGQEIWWWDRGCVAVRYRGWI